MEYLKEQILKTLLEADNIKYKNMTIWFKKIVNGKKKCCKSISLQFHPKHWELLLCETNGALKGRKEDTCYDFNIHFLGVFFSYTNWDYNCKINT